MFPRPRYPVNSARQQWLQRPLLREPPPAQPRETPALNPEERMMTMANWEQLSPFERQLFGQWLPGFAESSVGKALQRFGGTWMGKTLQYLDLPAEGVERTLGLARQFLDVMDDPVALADFQENLRAAWQAGHMTYDVSNLPMFRWGTTPEGKKTVSGVYIPTDMPGLDNLETARRKIAEA